MSSRSASPTAPFAVFAEIVERLRSPRPLYLEFGVHEGRTLRWWSEHVAAPDARFVGFDSFDGLPADRHDDAPAGSFRVDDHPRIDDPRVEIVPGWFSVTLPGLRWSSSHSSTSRVLE